MAESKICATCEYGKMMCQLERGKECPYGLEHELDEHREEKLYLYNIGYGTCEESANWQYYHRVKYTEEQIAQIVEDCFFAVLLEKKKPYSKWEHQQHPSLQDLMGEDTFHNELEKRGFQHIRFESRFYCFGWIQADVPESWDGHSSNEDKVLAENLKKRWEERKKHGERDSGNS